MSWYLRVEGAQLGPYSSSRVRSLLVNGQVSLTNEISGDRQHWRKIREVAEVVPLNLRAELGDRSAQALVHARRVAAQQANIDRKERFPIAAFSLVFLLVTSVVGFAVMKGLSKRDVSVDCQALPAPGVNWSNCILPDLDVGNASLQGADLSSAVLQRAKFTATNLQMAKLRYADLSGADMSYAQLVRADLLGANLQYADLSMCDLINADLRFADLTNGRMDGALLTGARFSGTIWLDGSVCAEGSIGECLQ